MLLRQMPKDLSKVVEVDNATNIKLQECGFYPVYLFGSTFYYPKIKEVLDCIEMIRKGGEGQLGTKNKV